MSTTLKLVSAITLSSAVWLAPQPSLAQGIAPMAFDCFDRSSGTLIARSAVDITSPAISCLPMAQPVMMQTMSPEPPRGPSMGEIIVGTAIQEGIGHLFSRIPYRNRISNITNVHNGNRCEGMASICGHGNGMGNVASGNASHSGNTSQSGNSLNAAGPTTNNRPGPAVFRPTAGLKPSMERVGKTPLPPYNPLQPKGSQAPKTGISNASTNGRQLPRTLKSTTLSNTAPMQPKNKLAALAGR